MTTPMRRFVVELRDKAEILKSAFFGLDTIGLVANEQLAQRVVRSLCLPGKTFIDVGAHIGLVSAEVAHFCPTAKIVAIEAVPEKAADLRRRFPKVEIHACAVGDATGEVAFYTDTSSSGYSSLSKSAQPGHSFIEIRVPIRRLDDIVTAADVDVIKIDVEGAELGVLRGCERILRVDRPIVMFESLEHSAQSVGYSHGSIHDFLSGLDYAVLLPNRLGYEDPGLGREGFLESAIYPWRTMNYFGVPKERLGDVRTRVRAMLKIKA